jgi:hypothetical protein
MSTILPEDMFGGRRMEGNSICRYSLTNDQIGVGIKCPRGRHTSLLSWVSKTATPASTLPTVNEISIVF